MINPYRTIRRLRRQVAALEEELNEAAELYIKALTELYDCEARNAPPILPPPPPDPIDPPSSAKLILNTDFESGISGEPSDAIERLTIETSSGPVVIPVQYEAGLPTDRFARLADSSLHFWVKNAVVPAQGGGTKARVQLKAAHLADFTGLVQSHRMYLHPDMRHYESFPGSNTWFTIQEFYVNRFNSESPDQFRISVNLAKRLGAGSPLRYLVTGRKFIGGAKRWENVWGVASEDFDIPFGEWIDVRTVYSQNSGADGQFQIEVLEDGTWTKIIDVTDWMYKEGTAPAPLTNYAPLKIYTGSNIIDHIRNQGGICHIYWDSLSIAQLGE